MIEGVVFKELQTNVDERGFSGKSFGLRMSSSRKVLGSGAIP